MPVIDDQGFDRNRVQDVLSLAARERPTTAACVRCRASTCTRNPCDVRINHYSAVHDEHAIGNFGLGYAGD